jgi:DNA-directed RNA polymerase specialized sigma24 family protein
MSPAHLYTTHAVAARIERALARGRVPERWRDDFRGALHLAFMFACDRWDPAKGDFGAFIDARFRGAVCDEWRRLTRIRTLHGQHVGLGLEISFLPLQAPLPNAPDATVADVVADVTAPDFRDRPGLGTSITELRAEIHRRLDRAGLTPGERAAIVAVDLGGETATAVARRRGCSCAAVADLRQRGLRKLRWHAAAEELARTARSRLGPCLPWPARTEALQPLGRKIREQSARRIARQQLEGVEVGSALRAERSGPRRYRRRLTSTLFAEAQAIRALNPALSISAIARALGFPPGVLTYRFRKYRRTGQIPASAAPAAHRKEAA